MNNKLNSTYKIKSHSLEIKDVDAKSRKVSMYLAHFGNIDSDQDMIVKGAFSKSLQERGVESTSNRKIAFLRHHDWKMQIGKFVEWPIYCRSIEIPRCMRKYIWNYI